MFIYSLWLGWTSLCPLNTQDPVFVAVQQPVQAACVFVMTYFYCYYEVPVSSVFQRNIFCYHVPNQKQTE